MLTNASGASIGMASYTPFGSPAVVTGQTTPMGWAGEYRDAESGLTYLRARYYDSSTGQFLTRDPLVSWTRSANAYASNNPINVIDPSGLASSHLPTLGDLWGGFTGALGCGFASIWGAIGDGAAAFGRNLDVVLLVGGSLLFVLGTMGAGASIIGVLGAFEQLATYGAVLSTVGTYGGLVLAAATALRQCSRAGVSSLECAIAGLISAASVRLGFSPNQTITLSAGALALGYDWIGFASTMEE